MLPSTAPWKSLTPLRPYGSHLTPIGLGWCSSGVLPLVDPRYDAAILPYASSHTLPVRTLTRSMRTTTDKRERENRT
jgi:hypothetical protein